VVDGQLVAAMQQERKSGRKHDGQECLTDDLPIAEVLELAGTDISKVHVIVSSFQAAGPGAIGMQRPLIGSNFSVFEPYDKRHLVVSHHLAHAATAAFSSGFSRCTVAVSDLGGSTTIDGEDFLLPFQEFERKYRQDIGERDVRTETRSFYRFEDGALELLDRDFGRPHNQPDVYMMSEAALYENMSQFVFRRDNTHGQFMALAGLSDGVNSPVKIQDIVDDDTEPARLRNGWQSRVRFGKARDLAPLAHVVQEAFTRLLVSQVKRAMSLSGFHDLAAAGGVFLNLPANARISELPEVDGFYVPSAPHDAGISVGCAFLGSFEIARMYEPTRLASDFLGPEPTGAIEDVPNRIHVRCQDGDQRLVEAVAQVMCAGHLVVRIAGPAEFGPRALGNRSILGHPVHCKNARALLNHIKGRQSWRPIAPITLEGVCAELFSGPQSSPFMNMNYSVRREHLQTLREVVHADGTARVQTLRNDDEHFVARVIRYMESMGELPVLFNTSLNGPGQPIINDISLAAAFAQRSSIRYLLTESVLFEILPGETVELPSDSALIQLGPNGGTVVNIRGTVVPVCRETFDYLCSSFEFGPMAFDAGDYERLRVASAQVAGREL